MTNQTQAITYLESILAPKMLVRHMNGTTEEISPAYIGPLKRKDLEAVLTAMKEAKAETST